MLITASALAGCMQDDGDLATRGPVNFLKSPAASLEKSDDPVPAETSVVITELQTRQSVLIPGSSYETVAKSVLAANARTAESELRSAKLRAQAASKNWLPTLGPTISLNSLGSVIATMFVEQVLFDNGRKKAERAFAKADVEVAAVNLAKDTNERVLTGLSLYLTAAKSRATAQVSQAAVAQMSDFEYIMGERVSSGVSNRADLQIIQQKKSEAQAKLDTDLEKASAAMAELEAMSALPVGGINAPTALRSLSTSTKALDVVLSEAEKERSIAEATISRAGYLPGAALSGTVGSGGNNLGVQVKSDKGLGFGMGASLKAIEAEKETAGRRVLQAQEDANRTLSSKQQRLASLQRQEGQAKSLLIQAADNLALFEEQYRSGQRPVMDVIGVYETKIRAERDYAAIAYDISLAELEIANHLGLLVNGADI
ncbi:TolC family protein [Algirhabdus cladophorae]|uniref:TolC family protein n=1 Tax=Algirhabdus cladophorae TaxID=3377108 RepID=UPI003B84833E